MTSNCARNPSSASILHLRRYFSAIGLSVFDKMASGGHIFDNRKAHGEQKMCIMWFYSVVSRLVRISGKMKKTSRPFELA